MAVALYYAWVRGGKPLHPCRPMREFLARLESKYPTATFGYWADDAHYQADNPLDHTPFSTSYWPIQPPKPWTVTATDIMPHQRGYDLDELAAYWVAEAKAKRFKALKDLIYKDRYYSVWNGFRGERYHGAYHGHIHAGFRTDKEALGLEGWSPIPPGEEDDMTPGQGYALHVIAYRTEAIKANRVKIVIPAWGDRKEKTETNELAALVRAIAAKVDISTAELDAVKAAAAAGAHAGALEVADALIAAVVSAVVANLPKGTLTPEDLARMEQAVRDAFAGGLAPDV